MTYLLQHEPLSSAAATDFIERMRDQQGYEYGEGDGCGNDEMEGPQNIARSLTARSVAFPNAQENPYQPQVFCAHQAGLAACRANCGWGEQRPYSAG